jgi:hypothetical protein
MPLRSVRIFPGAEDENAGIYIGHAQSISVDPSGFLYVPDDRNDEILVFSGAGRLLRRFGRSGQGPGEFLQPTGIFCGPDYVLVHEAHNGRFQFLSLDGKYQGGFRPVRYHDPFLVVGDSIIGACVQNLPHERESPFPLIDILDRKAGFGSLLERPWMFPGTTLWF